MTPIPEIRPQIIDSDLAEQLDEYMRFRYVVRHQYGFQLRWQLVKELADRLQGVQQRFVEQIRAFEQWLRAIDEESYSREQNGISL